MGKVGKAAWIAFAWPLFTSAQATAPTGTPARMVVTIGHFYSRESPVLTQDDLTITEDYEPRPITKMVPFRGDRAGLELFLLVDNCSSCEPGSKFEQLRRFIDSQPATTAIGVAYIQDGRLQVVENPTQDRERAIKALNPPTGNKPSNPFGALADLIKGWNRDSSRHAVLMISNGIDPTVSEWAKDPSAEAVIEEAQRANVTIYTMYHPSADYAKTDFSKIYSGQVQLAHIADETGGEAYFLTFGPLPSLAPFLADIADHLANQYLVEFLARPGETPSVLHDITVTSKNSDIEVMAPDRVWIPGVGATDETVPGER